MMKMSNPFRRKIALEMALVHLREFNYGCLMPQNIIGIFIK